jgi:hypothetical protein
MGCGCGKKVSRSKRKTVKKSNNTKKKTLIRKKKISKLISIPGTAKK